jgi:hypothetical protein
MWIFLNIVNLVDFAFCYTLKTPFYHFSDTKLIFLTGLIIKSGVSGGNFSCSSSVNPSQCSNFIQGTSGDSFAPLGSRNMVEELNTIPNWV